MLFGININGNVSFSYIKCLKEILNEFDFIFVGENLRYKHPFILSIYLLEYTKTRISTGIVSPYINTPNTIESYCKTMLKYYKNRFHIAIGLGDINVLKSLNIKPSIEFVSNFIKNLRKRFSEIKIFSGASGKRSIKEFSEISDGILLNFSSIEHLKWGIKHISKREIIKACYAPSLILPDEKLYKKLVIAAAHVFVGYPKSFLLEFNLEEIREKVLKRINDYSKLKEFEKFLIENFTISGSAEEIFDRIREYSRIGLDMVIFALPIYESRESIEKLLDLISSMRNF